MSTRDALARDLAAARERTLAIVDLDDDELRRQYHPLMSPLVWDLGHIGQQEEFWLLRGGNPDRPGMLAPEVDSLYDAFTHSRAGRADLPLLSPEAARAYCLRVRARALDALDMLPPEQTTFPFALIVSHEHQHDETMLQALNLRSGEPLLGPGAPLPAGRPETAGTSVPVAGGPFVLGVDAATKPQSQDIERPPHLDHLPAIRIGPLPDTNAE